MYNSLSCFLFLHQSIDSPLFSYAFFCLLLLYRFHPQFIRHVHCQQQKRCVDGLASCVSKKVTLTVFEQNGTDVSSWITHRRDITKGCCCQFDQNSQFATVLGYTPNWKPKNLLFAAVFAPCWNLFYSDLTHSEYLVRI